MVYTMTDRIFGWIKEGRLKRVLADWSRCSGSLLYYPDRRYHRAGACAPSSIACCTGTGDQAPSHVTG